MTESEQPASDEPQSEGKGKRRVNWFLILLIVAPFALLVGRAANAINTFATEVRDYKEILPDDLYTLIFDLDDRLSHWILLAASIGLFGSWFIYDRMLISPPVFPKNRILIVLVGVI